MSCDRRPNVSLRQLPAPGTIAASDLAARRSRTPTPPSQPFRGSSAKSGPATTSCVGPWMTSSGIATSGAGGPSGLQKDRGGGASQAEIRLRRPPGGHALQEAWEFQANSWPSGSTLRRSRLPRGQHVSNAASGAEQDERDDEAPCDLKRAASTRWPSSARWRQGLERGHRPDWPNPRGAAFVGVCPGHPKSYLADLTARRAAIAAHSLTSARRF